MNTFFFWVLKPIGEFIGVILLFMFLVLIFTAHEQWKQFKKNRSKEKK